MAGMAATVFITKPSMNYGEGYHHPKNAGFTCHGSHRLRTARSASIRSRAHSSAGPSQLSRQRRYRTRAVSRPSATSLSSTLKADTVAPPRTQIRHALHAGNWASPPAPGGAIWREAHRLGATVVEMVTVDASVC